jgi:hypothetical protein
VNDQMNGMWKEAVVVYFKAVSEHSPGAIEENHEKSK